MSRLRKENSWISELFEQGPLAAALIAMDGRVLRINREFSRLFGYAPREAQGRCAGELIVPDQARAGYQTLVDLLAKGVRVDAEGVRRRKDGSQFPAAISCVPISLPNGQAAAFAVYRDLTEQKRAEQTRAAEERRWRTIFDNSAVGITVTDAQGRFTAANRAYQHMVGYSQDELRALTYLDLTYEDDRPANVALAAELNRGEREQISMEKRYRRKDGRLIWVRNTVSRAPAAAAMPAFYWSIVEDITERKLAEQTLREYEKVVESAGEMIVVVDREYRYLIANQAFLNSRGLDRRQVIGHRVQDFMGADLFENVIKPQMDQCFQGKAVEFEMRSPFGVSGERDLLVSYFPIEGFRGVDRVAGILQDITGQKRSKEDLQHSFRQLRALTAQLQSVREQERTRLARELHDELGQALTAIKIDLSALRDAAGREPLSATVAPRITSIMNFVDRTIHSVRRISTELRPGILDDLGLVAAVEWAAEDFQARTGIECRVSLPDTDLAIDSARATALFRILQETLTNIARHAGASQADIALAQENGSLFLVVHDNGRGIGEKYRSTASSLGILGMRERAVLLGGDLDIAGDPGCGTTVKVRIPRADRAVS
jgi:PAS domain S-box-containing protein